MARKIEDFYDPPAPVEVVLFGGPHDGERIAMPWGGVTASVLQMELPDPSEPPPFPSTLADLAARPLFNRRRSAYRWNGSIQDDGARVYQVIP
jgi:hypothetical protein